MCEIVVSELRIWIKAVNTLSATTVIILNCKVKNAMDTDEALPMQLGPDASLLDYLACQMEEQYLSDLLYDNKEKVGQMVQRIPADAFPLRDWIDALTYFYEDTPYVPTAPQNVKSSSLDLLEDRGE